MESLTNSEQASIRISAVVCTRNNGERCLATVQSILANDHPAFELVLVDQSTDSRTAESVRDYLSDPRFVYVRSDTTGLSRCRNVGLRAARGCLAAVTDDDCTVPADWLTKLQSHFDHNPEVALVNCSVIAGPHDTKAGMVSAHVIPQDRIITSPAQGIHGCEAGLAVRVGAILAVGGFDELIGAGSRYPSGEGYDLTVRVLESGHSVLQAARPAITHHGFYRWQDVRALMLRDCRGSGAVYAKYARTGNAYHIARPARILAHFCGLILTDLVRKRRIQGVARVTALLAGIIDGMRAPYDRKTMLFTETRDAKPSSVRSTVA